MSLTVTVQKGHDFSSGNITRATLNAGAVPTVAVTGAVGSTEIVDGAITDAKVLSTAAIGLSKLQGLTGGEDDANHIMCVGTTDGNGAKLITSGAGYGGAAIAFDTTETAKVKITPSKNTIVASKLLTTDDTNVIAGLADADKLESVDVDDYLLIHDTSVTEDDEVRLKKVTVNKIQKVGTTEYKGSTITLVGSNPSYTATVDMDGAPFQTVTLSDSSGDVYYNFLLTNLPAGTDLVKTVTVRIITPAGTAVNFGTSASPGWPAAWNWPEIANNNGPASLVPNRVALLGLTAFGSNASDVIAAFVKTEDD